ncbi:MULTISPECIES: septum site-determining protein Ssd [Micromonospora]|uniref:Septum site-determining protein minD n=1 Tax=Micromonospora solifontis TaxID=2487138 RepID=A0ABX9WMK4_9ACTN|nr:MULTISPECIES: septum site-determining protein Ssd [Micromonospora]NES13255.1 septum site-determining protein minD [Micromonospora sp. PPF5-17B]NES34624.1 septum site-determining protein minD [Micromonospora solifontis]NES57012.1 septum site-determining protein minD [Micromonospora sp. PPF5-6]RNM01870.1 septum site-determining protein minD [Micromonospora solifontis]
MPPRTPLPPRHRLPLLVTADGDLLDELLRLAAAGGTEVELAADPAAARARWAPAPLVLVGADQAQACLRARLPRRSRTVLVGRSGHLDPGTELAELIGAEHVATLPAAEPWLVDRFAECTADPSGNRPARVVAVLGGRGGAGASVLAGGLAVTAARSHLRTLLVDADPLGGGLDLVLGWEQLEGLRWPGLTGTGGRVDPPSLVRALPSRGDLVVLSWDRGDLLPLPAEAMAATIDAGRRGRDVVVLDLPRHLDDAAVVALQSADRALVVVPAELRATAAAARVVAEAAPHCADLAVVVRGPAPGRLKATEVARALGLPLAGTLRPEPGLCRGLERGEAPAAAGKGPLAALCQRIVGELTGESTTGAA